MAESAVVVAIQTIGDLVIQEGKFFFGVRHQVKELRGELEALQSLLKDATARRHEHGSVRTWVRQAKRLGYEAEDIIEEYAIKVASKRGGGGFIKGAKRAASIVGEGFAIHKIGKEIGQISTEISSLIKRLESYGINRIIEAQPSFATIDRQRRQRTTYAHEEDEYFVGMEDDVSKIVTWVTEDHMIRRVISICGSGGSGKTTIARKVFNHIKKSSERSIPKCTPGSSALRSAGTGHDFECFAWVSVTQQCLVKMLLQDILKQILGEEVRDLEETELVRKLYDVLKTKKCFIVLDDIWNVKDWESLRPAFPTSEGSSKILLTTRITEVAEVAQQDSRHEPKLLDDKDGFDLLTKIAFNHKKGDTLPEQVELVVRDMLRKCRGLPLPISLLGGSLRNNGPEIEWDTINNKLVDVLAFSYDELPSYLRPCFLYMGCFREDEEIKTTHLYQLWMAEGLISTRENGPEKPLMDIARGFLYELISRNMVQLVKRDELDDNEKSCRLHDLMRDLCLKKGREEEFMKVKSIQIHGEEVGSICIDSLDLCRQTILVDCNNKGEISIAKSTGETCFRALIFNQSGTCNVEGTIKFKRLRSLILDNCTFKDNKLPEEIRDMIHLRYLSFRHSLKGELPAFISDLQYMQTLDIRAFSLQLPNIFHKMKRLRCLYLPYSRVQSLGRKKMEFHGLNELEILEGLDSKFDECTHLSESVNLRRLKAEIWDYEDLLTILEQLSSLLKLQYVSIIFKTESSRSVLRARFPGVEKLLLCRSLCYLELQSTIGNFPKYERQFWPHLVDLRLWNTKFEEDPMSFLQELPNLRKLEMNKDAYVGKEMYCRSEAFPKLTYLGIEDLPNIEKWKVDAEAFPNLQTLYIGGCRSLEEWTVDAGAFREVQTLQISDLPNIEKWRMGDGSFHKVQTLYIGGYRSLEIVQPVSDSHRLLQLLGDRDSWVD